MLRGFSRREEKIGEDIKEMSKTSGGWKCGVCYRWTGTLWINLEPEANYTEQYHACLLHICEIDELMKETGHFGALFAKVIVAQEAFIKKLAADQAFLKELIVQRLRIDSDKNSDKDFEAWFDEANGLKIKNRGQEIFKVDAEGNIDAICFTVISGLLGSPEILRKTSETITQNDLKPDQKMFYDGREVEKVGHVSTSSTIQSGIKYCIITGYGERGKIYFEAYSCSYCAWKTVYTIYFKDGTTREDIAQGTSYGDEVRIDKGHVYDEDELPAPLSRPYPTRSTGGPAPGNIIIKGIQKQRRIIAFKNLPTTDDDLSSLPIGALFTDAPDYILNGYTYHRPHVGIYMKTK